MINISLIVVVINPQVGDFFLSIYYVLKAITYPVIIAPI